MAPTESGVVEPRVGAPLRSATPASQALELTGSSADELRRHLNLARELALTQFKLRYTGSVLGYMWSLLKPAMLFAIMWVVFGYLFHADNASPNFTMQLLLGVVVWTFFAEATGASIASLAGNGGLIRKAYFPRAILVIAATGTAMLTFAINLALVLTIAGMLGRLSLGVHSLTAPFLLLELYALILGIALGLSALYVFYRDLGHLWDVTLQLLFYGSAVVYPFALLHSQVLIKLIAVNPVAQIIEDLRRALVSDDPRVPWVSSLLGDLYVIPLVFTALVLAVGAAIFRHLSPRFAENL